MALKPTSRRPVGRQVPTPRRRGKAVQKPSVGSPSEHNDTVDAATFELDPIVVPTQRDITTGLVDTDRRAAPGLDAERRSLLDLGPAGQPPAQLPPTLEEQKSDFTAEGSPPPGTVGTIPPAGTPAPVPRKHRARTTT